MYMAGIVAIFNHGSEPKQAVVYYLAHAMRMLQHRGKAYWKMMVGTASAGAEGSLPSDDAILKAAHKEKLHGLSGIGYLLKRSPPFPSMQSSHVAFDGFFVDTEKLHLHPYVGPARDSDSLYKIYYIFTTLLKKNPDRAVEFVDRHLRGNLIVKLGDDVYAYRDSTGFKPLVTASRKDRTINIIASENSLRASLIDMEFSEARPGQLIRMSKRTGLEVMATSHDSKLMMDPFEFIRESNVVATLGGKSIYDIRKNIGRAQADFLALDLKTIDLDSAYAEPDYTRPMALGFGLRYRSHVRSFELAEGVIKDRYDDSDNMIDFSEQDSKNKLLTTGRSLKFVMQPLVKDRKIATVQGTIQTSATARETIYYLRNAGAKRIDVVVSYVPTVDGRQVGLYTHNRELVANKYVGEVSSINELNENIAKELGADTVYYNSPSVLAKGIGVPEHNLWFPEWVRFLDYK
jgi:amidophosphoribosyltransferase